MAKPSNGNTNDVIKEAIPVSGLVGEETAKVVGLCIKSEFTIESNFSLRSSFMMIVSMFEW